MTSGHLQLHDTTSGPLLIGLPDNHEPSPREMDDRHRDPIAELITTWNELNSAAITEFDEEPSPLEFMRYVARNTPFVVRGAAAGWKATQMWSVAFLGDLLAGETVNVAVTPIG